MPRLRLSHWGGSAALHTGVLLALLALQASLHQPTPAKSIEWDIAMASSPAAAPPSPIPPVPEKPAPKALPTPIAAPREQSQPEVRQTAAPSLAVPSTLAPAPTIPTPNPPPAPPPEAPPEKPLADSAWLTNALWGMMNGRKHYPLQARRMGLEGKVIIEAEIDEHGQIIRADIKQSAGSSILDQDALALLKSVVPLKVDRYRLAPRTRVLIPITYVLE